MGGLLLLGLTSCGHKTSEIQLATPKSTPGAPHPSSSKRIAEKPLLPSSPSGHKIGLLLPLSGEHAELGKALLDAAEMALFEGENTSVILLPQDTAHGAKAAAERALKEGAELLLGPIFAADVKAIKPLLTKDKVTLICFSTDESVAGHGVYVLGFLPAQQIERIVGFAKLNGLTKIAALTPEDPYGKIIDRTLEHLASQGEVELLGITHYTRGDVLEGNPGNERILEAVKDYQNRGLQALLIPEGGENLHHLARFLKAEGVPLLLGSGQWDAPEILRTPELMGGLFASTNPQDRQSFDARFQKIYGNAPPRIASLAYDATAIAATLADKGYTSEHLTFSQGFMGVDGLFRLTPLGLNERGLTVIEVTPSGFQSLSEAPQAF